MGDLLTSEPVTVDIPVPASALAIGAHPDDIEFGCGATLAKWASSGLPAAPSGPHRRLEGQLGPGRRPRCAGGRARSRSAEPPPMSSTVRRGTGSRRHDRVLFLGRVDGELENGVDERREVARIIRTAAAGRRAGPRPLAPIPPASRPPRRRVHHPRRSGGRTGSAFLPRARGGPPPTGGAVPVRGRRTQPRRGRRWVRGHQGRGPALPPEPVGVDHGHRRGRSARMHPPPPPRSGNRRSLPPRSGRSWPRTAHWPDSMRPRRSD